MPLQTVSIHFAQVELLLDAAGAIWWPQQRILIVSDLHLEKGSFFAARGYPLPLYDTRETLKRLEKLITSYQPEMLICLGDSFHDKQAVKRLPEDMFVLLRELQSRVRQWVWITGNHDPEIDFSISGTRLAFVDVDNIRLCHEPEAGATLPQLVGHFHPKASYRLARQKLTGKCFIHSPSLLIMPSFGAYTGGLDCNAEVIAQLFAADNKKPIIHLLYNNKLWDMQKSLCSL